MKPGGRHGEHTELAACHFLVSCQAPTPLTMEAAEVAEQLASREAELAVTEGRLAEIEKRGSALS